MMYLRQKKGFTLIEIMIVVAIIGLLAAIAIPNLLRSRMSANDGAIQDDLRAAATATESFRSDQNPPSYPANLAALTAAAPPYLDVTFVDGGVKHGHTLTFTRSAAGIAGVYALTAATIANQSSKNYCIDTTGVLRGQPAACAQAAGVCAVACPPVAG